MEALLSATPRSVVIGTMRALLVPLKEHWGDAEAFIEAGMAVLKRESGGALADPDVSPKLLEAIFRQSLLARALHFRAIEDSIRLEQFYRELDAGAARGGSPMQEGVLWLASRMQFESIDHLASAKGKTQLETVYKAAQERPGSLIRTLREADSVTMVRVSGVLSSFVREVLGDKMARFEISALAGHLVELLRANARRLPDLDAAGEEVPEHSVAAALLTTLTPVTRQAEVNEARQRFSRLSEEERTKRFNRFRLHLGRIINEVARYAPEGLDFFAQAIEATMYPYPARLEYIHAFAKSVHNSGERSTLFDDASTPQSVQQRYEQIKQGGQVAPLMLELARAFALRSFRQSDRKAKREYMLSVDLAKEFGWPSSLDALR